jgi:hypothetical protein
MPSMSAWPSKPPAAPSRAPIAPSFSAPPTRRPGESPRPTQIVNTGSTTEVKVNPSAAPKLPVMELQLGIRLSSAAKQSSQASTILSKITDAISGDKVGKAIREKLAGLLQKDPSQISIASVVETANRKVRKLNQTSPCNRMPRSSSTGGTNTALSALATVLERLEDDDRPAVCVPDLSSVDATITSSLSMTTTTTSNTAVTTTEPDIKIGVAVSLRVPAQCDAFQRLIKTMENMLTNMTNNLGGYSGSSGSSSGSLPQQDVWPEEGASAGADMAVGRVLRGLQTTTSSSSSSSSSGDLTMDYSNVETDFSSAANMMRSADLADITSDVALNAGLNPADLSFTMAAQPALMYAAPQAASSAPQQPNSNNGGSGSSSSNGGAIAAGIIVTGLVVVGAFVVVRAYRKKQGTVVKPVRRTSVAGQGQQMGTFNPLNSPMAISNSNNGGNNVIMTPVGVNNPMLVMAGGVGNNGLAMINVPLPGSAMSMHNATLATGQAFRADDAAASRAAFKPFRASFANGQPGAHRNSSIGKGTSV